MSLLAALQRRREKIEGKIWADEVLPVGVWLGSGQDASNLQQLKAHGITHVLNVADDVQNFHEGTGIEYCNLSVGDFGTDAGISRVFPTALGFVRSALESPGGRVLIHCANGSNRSATVAIAVVMDLEGLPLAQAVEKVKAAHPPTAPLRDNQIQLLKYANGPGGGSLSDDELEKALVTFATWLDAPLPSNGTGTSAAETIESAAAPAAAAAPPPPAPPPAATSTAAATAAALVSEHGEGALLLRAAQADPQLAAFAVDLPALHARLAALSEALAAADPEASFFRQLTFSGENANPLFVPNRFKPDMGEDGRKITSYHRYAVKEELHAKAAVETACASTPSVVVGAAGLVETFEEDDEGLSSSAISTKTAAGVSQTGGGAVYQGGFKVVGNARFLREKKVSLVVNTARNLGDFFPKFNRMVASAKAGGAEFLELGWLDDERQVVSADDLSRAVRAVHAARLNGGSVVVHCAQGRSRSGTVSVAYVATLLAMKGGDDGGGGGGGAGTPTPPAGNASLGSSLANDDLAAAGGGGGGGEQSAQRPRPRPPRPCLIDRALALVQKGRSQAQPNRNFLAQLKDHERDGLFARLAQELADASAE